MCIEAKKLSIMDSNKFLLSICMPTYNRCELLYANISRYIPICQREKIEIVIGDNASTDNTCDICKQLSEKYAFVNYVKYDKNIGYDRNVLSCIDRANGEYVWILGDRRGIKPEKLPEIIDILKNREYEVVAIGKCVNEPYYKTNTPSDLLRNFRHNFRVLCNCIVRNPVTDVKCYQRYIDHLYIHVAIVFESLCSRKASSSLIINSNDYFDMVADASGSKGQHGWIKNPIVAVVVEWYNTIMQLPNSIDFDAKMEALKDNYTALHLRHVIPGIAKGWYKKSEFVMYKKYIPLVTNGKIKLWQLNIAYHIPSFFFKIPYKILATMNHKYKINDLWGIQ